MRDPFELLKNADECVSRSHAAANDEQRRILLETADAWRKLAEQVVRMNEFAEKCDCSVSKWESFSPDEF